MTVDTRWSIIVKNDGYVLEEGSSDDEFRGELIFLGQLG